MVARDVHYHWITASGDEGNAGSADAIFPYWSFTKTAIAICALKLGEAGAADLGGSIDGAAYTYGQLLAHTSGLPDYGQFPEYGRAVRANERPWPREKMLNLALSDGMLFQPGQGWSYSNIGYMFLREKIEQVSGQTLGQVISNMICKPLALGSVEMGETREQFATLHWPAAAHYDPLWVYHGCLFGTAADAARLLHGLFSGALLRPETLSRMTETRPLGGPLPGRPWAECGYALGLMTGSVDGVGRALGHSGAGPFCVNAVYHFPDAENPITVAAFTDGTDEGIAEFAAADLAKGMATSTSASGGRTRR